MVRVFRTLGAVLAWLVATVLLTVAIVLCITVVLIPLGLLVGYAALYLYKIGLKLMLPRSRDVGKGVRKELRQWGRTPAVRRLRRAVQRPRKPRWRTFGRAS